MITDVPLNDLKRLARSTGNLLRYDTPNSVTLYWINQGQVIFRSIIIKDPEERFNLFLQQLPSNVQLIMTPLEERNNQAELRQIIERLDKIERRLI